MEIVENKDQESKVEEEKAPEETKQVKPVKESKPDDATARDNRTEKDEQVNVRTGTLDLLPDGFGFLRTKGYVQSDNDIYVSLSQIRRFSLRRGDEVTGQVREPKDSERNTTLFLNRGGQRDGSRAGAPAAAL